MNLYDLVALQLNLSGGTGRQTSTISRKGTQFLIKEFIRQSDPIQLPNPAFVALQDGISDTDCENIESAFKERRNIVGSHLVQSKKRSKGVSLLYDRKVLTERTDNDCALKKDIFFDEDEGRKKVLFERIAGGLFQHNQSTQFIVAISYHGLNTSGMAYEKQEYVTGNTPLLFN